MVGECKVYLENTTLLLLLLLLEGNAYCGGRIKSPIEKKNHILLLLLFLNEEDNVYCGGKLEKTSL